jgi:hypothetical protein
MHEIPQLDRDGLRRFGLVTGSIVAVLFGIVIPYLWSLRFPLWPWWVAGILAIWSLIWPQGLKPVYRNWMKLGLAIGAVMNRVVLGIAFYLLFFPMGMAMRLFGHDPMARSLDPRRNTYRVPSKPAPTRNMEKPF